MGSSFGTYFRALRIRKGGTLRGFCQANGLDPGNISRLERGMIPPPESQLKLRSYAEALGLKNGTKEWIEFFDQAAASGRKLPADLSRDEKMLQKLPVLFRRLRTGRVTSGMNAALVDGSDLNLWADSRRCQEDMPMLIRRLIRETVEQPARVEFRSGEGVQLEGWDGIVETHDGNAYVPKGASFWEVGTGTKPGAKAEGDYKKRTCNQSGVNRGSSTFVFVTPRRWARKNQWADKKRRDGKWSDVRAYDADDLEQWLEVAPSTATWLARYVGKHPRGIRCLEDYWYEFSVATSPEFSPGVLMAGREESVKQLCEWLRSGSGVLRIRGESTAEVLAFISAVVAQLGEEDLLQRAARCLVVDDIAAAREAITRHNPLTLIWNVAETDAVPEAIKRGHSIILPEGRRGTPLPKDGIELPRPSYEELVKELKLCGLEEERGRKQVRATGGHIQPLRRRLAHVPSLARPQWALPERAPELMRLLFAGYWDERQEGDRRVVESLAQAPWEAIARTCAPYVEGDDAPLKYVGGVWQFVAPFDAWHLLGGYVGLDGLMRFVDVAIDVLSHESSRLAHPPDKRWMALDPPFPHSHFLREGVAQTIGLLGVLGEQGTIANRAQDAARRIVMKLLDDGAGWQRWYSLAPLLPYLAEAAPDEFLAALDDFLVRDEASVKQLFAEEGALGGNSPHNHILWALERLAWLPRYLGQATVMLGRLEALHPGEKPANRPAASLAEVFVLWHPNTGASLDERLMAIDLLLEREPKVGWDLLLSLLPQFHSVMMPTSTPEWREYPASAPVMAGEYFRGIQGVIERALRAAGQDPARIATLIKECAHWPPELREALASNIRRFCSGHEGTEDRMKIWEALREFVNTHRAFATAEWALPEVEVKKLEGLVPLVEPADILTKTQWLFDDWYPRLPGAGVDVTEGQKQIDHRRTDAVREILDQKGVAGILALARAAKYPGLVGQAASAQSPSETVEREILSSTLGSSENPLRIFGWGFVIDRYARLGEAWAEKALPLVRDSTRALVTFFLALPVSRRTWEQVAASGPQAEKLYWEEVRAYLGKDEQLPDVQFAMERLYNARRIADVIHTAWLNAARLSGLELVRVLESAIAALNEKRMELTQDTVYSISQVMSALPDKPGVSEETVARFEWAFLPLLRHGPVTSSPTLHRTLAKAPSFFAEVIGLVYRPESAEGGDSNHAAGPSEERRAKARLGHDLLRSWTTPLPGAGGEGGLDEAALKNWIAQARADCGKSGHSASGDSHIGRILAYAPAGRDGVWPHEAVRSVLDLDSSRAMEAGFTTGVFNKRGVWTKNIGDGGAQERSLSQGFRRYADAMNLKYPKTARLLRSIADQYDRMGAFEDDRVSLGQ